MSARYDGPGSSVPPRRAVRTDPPKPVKRRVLWSISDERGRRIADGLTPEPMDDREALSWVLRGGPHDGKPPTIELDRVYRFTAGQCSTTARGDELERVDHAGKLDEVRLVAERELSGAAAPHLYDDPARTVNADDFVFPPATGAMVAPLWDMLEPVSIHPDAERIMREAIDAARGLQVDMDTARRVAERLQRTASADDLCARVIRGDPQTLEELGIAKADIQVIHPMPAGGHLVQVTLRPGAPDPRPVGALRMIYMRAGGTGPTVYQFEEVQP